MDQSNNHGIPKEDLNLFLTEAVELLDNTEANLLELEKSPGDSSIVNEIFRAMHTIKGGAGMLQLSAGVEVTHAMETILDQVRSGQKKVTSGLIDVLFAVLDWLRAWTTALQSNAPEPNPEDIKVRIGRLDRTENAKNLSSGQDRPLDDMDRLKDLQNIADQERAKGKNVVVLSVRFASNAPLLSVRLFQVLTLVSETCDVLGSTPTQEEIERDKVSDRLEIVLALNGDARDVEALVKSVQDVIEARIRSFESPTRPEASQNDGSVRKTSLGKTIRVDVSLLDFLMNMVGELVIDRTRLSQIAARLTRDERTLAIGSEIAALASHLQRTSAELQEGIMRARLLPLRNIFGKFPRMVRDLASKCGKEVLLEVSGEDTELDRTVLEAIDDPLIHILRNAVDHGIEMPEQRERAGKPAVGKITLSAWHEENQVLVRVTDDGGGIDIEKVKRVAVKKGLKTQAEVDKMSEKEACELIFLPGFSTADVATEVSGRGVGMDVVRSNLERINGQVEVRTMPGQGTEVTLRLPLTLAIMRALLVRAGKSVYAVPTSSVTEVILLKGQKTGRVKGKTVLSVRDRVMPLVSLEGVLRDGIWDDAVLTKKYAVLTRNDEEPLALAVDELIGEEEIVVKEMGRLLSRLRGVAGATILAEGDPAVILDVNRLL